MTTEHLRATCGIKGNISGCHKLRAKTSVILDLVVFAALGLGKVPLTKRKFSKINVRVRNKRQKLLIIN